MKFIISLIIFAATFTSCRTAGTTRDIAVDNDIDKTEATVTSGTKQTTKNPKKEVLISTIDKEDLMEAPFSNWFTPSYNDYTLDKDIAKAIGKTINDYKVTVFMGTWCSDSRREIPKLYKILEAAKYDMSKLKVIAVDRKKTTPKNLQEGYAILKVPTIIFSKKGKEVNRFVEYARESLAQDILKIVSNQPYKHSYAE